MPSFARLHHQSSCQCQLCSCLCANGILQGSAGATLQQGIDYSDLTLNSRLDVGTILGLLVEQLLPLLPQSSGLVLKLPALNCITLPFCLVASSIHLQVLLFDGCSVASGTSPTFHHFFRHDHSHLFLLCQTQLEIHWHTYFGCIF